MPGPKTEMARLLLEKGAAVDAQRKDGATALMLACLGGHVEAARLLLEKGADRTLGDKDGDTAGAKAAAEDTKQITHVHVTCKPGTEDEFIEACLANAASSVLEPDNLRFDVLRHRDEPNKFMLVEVYATSEGPVAHKATPHYNEWRTTVEPFMM